MLSTYLTPSSSHSHLIRLIQETRFARIGSIEALHMQYKRMLPPDKPHVPDPYRSIPGAFPSPVPRYDSVTRGGRSKSRGKVRSRSNSPKCEHDPGRVTIQPYPNPDTTISPNPQPDANKLFCVYARDLQEHSRLPLSDNFKSGRDHLCPFCHAHFSIRPGKAWEIIADGRRKDGRHERRIFLVNKRFIVKCHREGKGFACVLCARFKEADTVCKETEALIDHLWREHMAEELEKDDDIFEVDE